MNKNLPLYILLIFLILVNAFFLYNYLGSEEVSAENRAVKRSEHFLVKELQFDESQKESYRALTKANRPAMREVLNEIRELKDALYNGLSDNSFKNSAIDSIASLIGEKEKQKDILIFRHFKEVQKICNKLQKEKFAKIINYAIRIEGKPQGPPRAEGRDGNRPPPPDGPGGDRPPPPEH
jgi:FtsZ-interacting cell division protein YlmF